MLATILSGIICAVFLVFFGKILKTKWGILIAAIPFGIFIYYASYLPLIRDGYFFTQQIEWVPSLNINLDFKLDSLSLLFTLLISGIGTGIFLYAYHYLHQHLYIAKFYGYLCLFMASMLGLVLSDNIFVLFTFWELTSISSFFLIGFHHEEKESRSSALRAFNITGLGGFFLLAGFVGLSMITGSNSIMEIAKSTEIIQKSPYFPYILCLIILGAATKSAQFPFHFWLPGAMKAPTPVSAYLHSATMVKAGIYLLARMNPVLGNNDLWMYILMITGGITMIYGAFHTLFRTDLKGVLAYSTISALGIIVFLIGIGTSYALYAAMVFIVVHALYKATLFLITGIIDHETGTRDLTVLAGLFKKLKPVGIAGILAALSSAGIPFTIGFIGKDLIYESTLHFQYNLAVYLTGLAVVTNILLASAGFMTGMRPFIGKLPQAFDHVHLPSRLMWIPPFVFAFLGVCFGCFPAILGDNIVNGVVQNVQPDSNIMTLKIWHGFNTVLMLSGITILCGLILFILHKPSSKSERWIHHFDMLAPISITDQIARGFTHMASFFTHSLHNGYLRSYILKIIIFAEILIGYRLFLGGPITIDWSRLSPVSVYEICTVLILIAALVLILRTKTRLTSIVASSVVGFSICLIFVFYSAPDLAMTQFTIDTLTVVLFALVLFKLPTFLNYKDTKTLVRDALVSITMGIILILTAIRVLKEPISTEISDFYGNNAYLLAKGKNVVNVILVDFRGFDTMFEIVVLSIAALGVYSLMKLKVKSTDKE